MEIKKIKSLTTYNTEKEEFPIQIKEIKTLYQCNTLKNFNKSKNIPKILEDTNEYENENELQKSKKRRGFNNDQDVKLPLSIRYTVNYKGIKPVYESTTPQKNTFYKNLNRSNNDLINNNKGLKNLKKSDNKKFPLSAVKKENEKNILKSFISQKISKTSLTNNNISNSASNKAERETFMSSLNNIVIENKKKIKHNQGKLNNIIKLIKTKETDKNKRNNEDNDNNEIVKENRTEHVFRYIKKIPPKNNEVSSQTLIDKNENITNLKKTQMKKQNTIDSNNFIINGLNQIYKKSFNVNEEKYHNYLLNKDDNKNKNNKQNQNVYPNKLSTNLKNSESVNNMKVKISINDIKNNKDRKDNIYVNKIKTNRDNILNNNKNIHSNKNTDNNSFKYNKKKYINNINLLNYDSKSIQKEENIIENKNNLLLQNQHKVNSPKSIYIPKKATSFRGVSQENDHNIKRKNMSPIYYKKIDNEKNTNKRCKINKTKNENEKDNEQFFYYFNSEKRTTNKNKYIDYYINNNGRATYSRKYSIKKQNYCWKSNSSFDDKIKKSNNKEDNKIINNNQENNFDKNEIFENEINDISSIKINSSYDSYTMDCENNTNRIKFPIFENEYNKNEKKNNLVYFHNYNGGDLNNDNKISIKNNNKKNNINNNIKTNKYSATSTKQNNNLNKKTPLLNNKDKYDIMESHEKISSFKNNLRYNNSDKKFSEKYSILNNQNIKKMIKKDPNCYSSTTFSFPKKQINNTNEQSTFKGNNYNKSQQNYYLNKNQKNKKEEKNINQNNKKNNNILNKILKTEKLSLGLDDLVVLEERFRDIISSLDGDKPVYNTCFDFWNYFKNNCEILSSLNLLIKNEDDFIVIKNGIYYILMSIIFTFDYSYKKNLLNQIILFLKEIINFNYQNLILIYDYLLNNTLLSKVKNIWEIKLLQIISNVKSDKDNNTTFDNLISNYDSNVINNNNNDNLNNIGKIKNNITFIFQTIKIIIKNYKNKNSNILLYFFKEIHKKSSLKDFFYFFKNKILHSNGLFGYMSPQLVLKQNHNSFHTISHPYLKNYPKKKYCLIIGLEETLISFKFGHHNNNGISGVIRFRPGINYFLSEMKKYFEIIVFSLYPQKIADYLINTLEKKEKYFDCRLFIQHSIIIENEFVKDLRRIGRPMDKMIIVDNIPQNYKLSKKNGINIKSYWEEDYNDTALNELANILIKIVRDGGDVREGIEKYRKEIICKVTSRIDL